MSTGALADDAVGRRIRTRLMVVGLGVVAPLNLLTTFAGPFRVTTTRESAFSVQR